MGKMPFIFGKSSDFKNFTDREEESFRLEMNFRSLVNTTIISPRRWGKTSLVEHVARNIRTEQIKICMIDVFNVRSESEFYEHFAKGVLSGTSSRWEELIDNAKKFLSHLLPQITFSPDSQTEISFGVGWEKLQNSPDEILDLPETIAKAKNISVIVCVDEFQTIGSFPESLSFQRKLRSHWQHHQHVGYCLYGSKRSMLIDIFANVSMPFYKFGDILFLQKISNKKWGEFIKKRFEDTGKNITIEQAEYLAGLVDNHSYYVQQLAQQAWIRTQTDCSEAIIDDSLQSIKNQLSLLFVSLMEAMTGTQINFLKAVLDGETAFTSQENLKKYRLGSSANLKKIKNTLIAREIIDITIGKVVILDPIFELWLKEDIFKTR